MSQLLACQKSKRSSNYDPVLKIQALINNLDSQLAHLVKQNSVTKPLAEHNSNRRLNYGNASAIQHPPVSTLTKPAIQCTDTKKRQLRNVYRARVIDAYRNRRIFTVYGNYHTVRRALMRRGWLEKLPPSRYPKLQSMSEDMLLELAHRGNDYETVAISKMINHFPAFFVWHIKGQQDYYKDVLPYRNRVRRNHLFDFSTKVGLVGCAEQERWFREDGVCGMSYPRFYRLGDDSLEERLAFIDDYQQTQARCLLRYIQEHKPNELIDMEHGTINSTTLDLALQKVKRMILNAKHHSLDDVPNRQLTPAEMAENQTFMEQARGVIKSHAKFKVNESIMSEYARLASDFLKTIEEKRPDFKWDGCRNLWILKPGYQSRGIGIVIRSSLDDILQWTSNNQNKKYIVQKYIERPFLIYRTKFDIRQYMLITIGESQVTMWMYRDCYLRFSSQEFTMDDLRESIHLTNNAVQKRYKNKTDRDPRLPKKNMWSLDQFKCHLKHVGAPDDTWSKIYKGFKQNLVAVVLASLDETELVQNAFELYGCDFMLDEQYNPILIEINATPDLSPSTEVTARICPLALKDCIRVVVDLPKNPNASTGLFELAFQVNYNINKTCNGKQPLELSGKQMTIFELPPQIRENPHTRLLRTIISNVKTTTRKISGKEKISKAQCCSDMYDMENRQIEKWSKPKSDKDKAEAVAKASYNAYAISKNKKKSNKRAVGSKTSSATPSAQPSVMDACAFAAKTVLSSVTRENLALQYTLPK